MDTTTNTARTNVLDRLFSIGCQLDAMHKHAANEPLPGGGEDYALTSDEYDALNDALNYYRGIVEYLWAKQHGIKAPEGIGFPQTLSDLLSSSRIILQVGWDLSNSEADVTITTHP